MINGFIRTEELENIWAIIKNENAQIKNYIIERNADENLESFTELWQEQLSYRFLLHELNNTNKTTIRDISIKVERISNLDFNFDLITESGIVESLLKYIFHPSYDPSGGLKVGFKSEEDQILFGENLKKGLLLIEETDPDAFVMIRQNLKVICPIYSVNPLKKGDVISLSLDYCNGVIFYSPCPFILTAETLIHETRHNLLNLILKKVTLLKNNELKVKTPLRDDLRPMLGLIHQAYVLFGLTNFYRKLTLREPYNSMENVRKRYNLHVNDYNEARDALEIYRSNLSNEGIKFLNELINDIKKHG
jgi:hypothetical protein